MGRRRNGESREVNYMKAKTYLASLKYQSGCIECGEDDPRCLDFHHVDPTTKRFHLGNIRGRTMKELHDEVRKCVVMCSNCHRKLHTNPIIFKEQSLWRKQVMGTLVSA